MKRNTWRIAGGIAMLLTACGGTAHDDAGVQDAAPTDAVSQDAAVGDSSGGDDASHAIAHYAPCQRDGDCVAGDTCSVPTTDSGPTTDTNAPKQCRPACTGAGTSSCGASAADAGGTAVCSADHRCTVSCAELASLPPCTAPYTCHEYQGLMYGYCLAP